MSAAAARALLSVSFASTTPGSAPALSGLSFARSGSGRTAQTSASTLTTTDPGANVPVAEWSASGNGLSLYGPATNLITASRAWTTGGGWTAGASNTATAGQASPDGGSSGYRQQILSAGYGPYFSAASSLAGTPVAFSIWAVEGSGAGSVLHTNFYRDGANYIASSLSGSYQRLAFGAALGGVTTICIPADGRAGGSLSALALDVIADCQQLEATRRYASPYVPTSGSAATRNGEHLYHTDITKVTRAGRLIERVTFIAPCDSSQLPWAGRLWTVDANNYAEVGTNRLIKVVTNGVAYTAPGLCNWLAGDAVTVEHCVGGGALTMVSVGANGVQPVLLGVSATAQHNVPSSGAIDILCNGTASQLESSAVQLVEFW